MKKQTKVHWTKPAISTLSIKSGTEQIKILNRKRVQPS